MKFLAGKVIIPSIPHVAMLIPCVYSEIRIGRGAWNWLLNNINI